MRVYDFDKTIYNGDCSIDFFLYALCRKKSIIFRVPSICILYILCKLNLVTKKRFKEEFFSFLKCFKNNEVMADEFVNHNLCKIKNWYLLQQDKDDVIITASPEVVVQKFLDRMEGQKCIGTKVNIVSGTISGENCYGEEKVNRFNECFGNQYIDVFYTDSFSDAPMMELAQKSFLVKGDRIIEIYSK